MNVAVAALEYPLVTYTIFPDVWPTTKTERSDVAWQELVERVKNSPTYIDKKHCPLISIAEYGDVLSAGKNPILRHGGNITRVFGCEIDYDGEQMPIEEAASKFHDAGICALLYTSPSHKPDKPRWRALLPFSEPYHPEKRMEYTGRANRILGGVATRESFTLSQSFYIGRVTGAEYIVIDIGGATIDYAVNLDPLFWVDKHNDGERAYSSRTDADLRACFAAGSGGRYEAMLSLSSRWAARGMARDDIEASLFGLLELGGTTHNKDGIDLRTRVEPMARSAVAKFGESRPQRPAEQAIEPDPQLPPADDDRFAPLEGEAAKPAVAVEQPKGAIEARVFDWIDTANLGPREWLYGKHYMRGMVSATAGVGGAGKSTLLNVELVSMAIGRDLLDGGKPIPVGPLSVWGHNGEDPYVELQRRVMAVCRHYGVTKENLGDRLRITSGRDTPLLLARELTGGGHVVVPTDTGARVAAEIEKHGIQVFVIDPFVTIHQVNENDNGMIDDVMGLLRDLANKANCSVEVAHHFRKLNGDEPSVDSIRGASSIVGAARSARIVAGMSKDEAAKYGLQEDQRGFYSWLQNGKANMLPPTHKRRWMQMQSVCLDNAVPPFEADEVGVVATWTPPDCESALNGPEYRALRKAIKEAPVSQRRATKQAKGWIGSLMAEALGLEPSESIVKSQMQAMIARLVANGSLAKGSDRDPVHCRVFPILTWKTEGETE